MGGESAFFREVVRKISEKGPVWKSRQMEFLGQDRTGKGYSRAQGSRAEKATGRRQTSENEVSE